MTAAPHITICFEPHGVNFYPEGDLRGCEERLARIVQLLHERPTLIACALGVCGGEDAGVGHVH